MDAGRDARPTVHDEDAAVPAARGLEEPVERLALSAPPERLALSAPPEQMISLRPNR